MVLYEVSIEYSSIYWSDKDEWARRRRNQRESMIEIKADLEKEMSVEDEDE